MPNSTPKEIPIEFVRSLLIYDPLEGSLTWKTRSDVEKRGNHMAGKQAGYIRTDGYRTIRINSTFWMAHRLIWAIVKGEWPAFDLDHINGIRSDNRWINLRPATRQENLRNSPMRANNKSGYKWVSFHKKQGWFSRVRNGERVIFIGYFETAIAAHEAAKKAAIQFHGEFARF